MQNLVGIVRNEAEMVQAVEELKKLSERTKQVHVSGNLHFNPGWHTALDLDSLMVVSEAISRAAILRKESRGGHFREDYTEKDAHFGKVNFVVRKGEDGSMQVLEEKVPEMPDELKQIIENNK
jgi:succinate dehydrogenase / fumarate reductase flavoprotein subunit